MGHPIHYHYQCHFYCLDFQGLVFVVVLVHAVGLMVVVEFLGVVLQVIEFDEFLAVVLGITKHLIFLNGIVNCMTFCNYSASHELCVRKLCRKVSNKHSFDLIVIIFEILSEYCHCCLINGTGEYNISFLWIWIFENGTLSKASFQIL